MIKNKLTDTAIAVQTTEHELERFETEEELAENQLLDFIELATTITSIATDCSTGTVPLQVPRVFFQKYICRSWSKNSELCQNREFLELIRKNTRCSLKTIHVDLTKLVIDIELEVKPIFMGDFSTIEFKTFDFYNNGQIQRLNLPDGIYLHSKDISYYIPENGPQNIEANDFVSALCARAILESDHENIEKHCSFRKLPSFLECAITILPHGLMIAARDQIQVHKNDLPQYIEGQNFYAKNSQEIYKVRCHDKVFTTMYETKIPDYNLRPLLIDFNQTFLSKITDEERQSLENLLNTDSLDKLEDQPLLKPNHFLLIVSIAIIVILLVIVAVFLYLKFQQKENAGFMSDELQSMRNLLNRESSMA